MSEDLKETETRINRFLAWIKAEKSFAKFAEFELNPPATDDQLAEVEALIGRVLPADMKALYRRFNGEALGKELGVVFGHLIEPLDRVIDNWLGHWSGYDQGYHKPVAVRPNNGQAEAQTAQDLATLLCLSSDGGGSYIGIDLDPSEGGSWGQVVIIEDDYYMGEPENRPKRPVVSPSLTAFLGWIVEALESERFFSERLKREVDAAQAAGEPLDGSPWMIAGVAIDHLHEVLLEELSKAKLLGPKIATSPFDFPTDALRKASSPVRPEPSHPDGIARTGERPWTPRPTPRAMRASHVDDGSLPVKVQTLVDLYRKTRRRFKGGPFMIKLIGQGRYADRIVGQLVEPGIVQEMWITPPSETHDAAIDAIFEALGFTADYLPRRPTASRYGSICIVVRGTDVTWTVTDPDQMPIERQRPDESTILAAFSAVFGEIKEVRPEPKSVPIPQSTESTEADQQGIEEPRLRDYLPR